MKTRHKIGNPNERHNEAALNNPIANNGGVVDMKGNITKRMEKNPNRH